MLVNPIDNGLEPKILFMLNHSVCDGDNPAAASRRLQFVAVDSLGTVCNAGLAPHLDVQPIAGDDFWTPLLGGAFRLPTDCR